LPPTLNMEIRKWGRSTGYSRGFVDGIHLATNIDYGNEVVRYFNRQFHVAPLFHGEDVSQVGDSGSLVLTSFRPRDMEKHLAKLCEWFQYCCDARGRKKFCKDIKEERKKLDSDCDQHCKDQLFCKFLKLATKSVDEYCMVGTTKNLCRRIARRIRRLRDSCGAYEECLEFFDRVDVFLGEIEKYPQSQLSGLFGVCCRLEGAMGEVDCPTHEECFDFNEAFKKAVEELIDSCKVGKCGEFFELVRKKRENLRLLRREIKKCVLYCHHVVEIFEEWFERCRRIYLGEEECKRICEILTEECKESTCKDPSELVACVEKALAKLPVIELTLDEILKNEKPMEPDGSKATARFVGGNDKTVKNAADDEPSPKPTGDQSWLVEQLRKHTLESVHEAGLEVLGYDSNKTENWFLQLLKKNLSDEDFLSAVINQARAFIDQQEDDECRNATRVYYAVGLIFAGDTPGSPFGEFAVASDIEILERELRFSLRPVFEPRSSFRELRVRPPRRGDQQGAFQSNSGLAPGVQSADPRGGGPQPDLEPAQTSSGNRGGGG